MREARVYDDRQTHSEVRQTRGADCGAGKCPPAAIAQLLHNLRASKSQGDAPHDDAVADEASQALQSLQHAHTSAVLPRRDLRADWGARGLWAPAALVKVWTDGIASGVDDDDSSGSSTAAVPHFGVEGHTTAQRDAHAACKEAIGGSCCNQLSSQVVNACTF
jgi:hypothetical protein